MDAYEYELPPLEEMVPNRKPRIGLMGEFSAGKSTLSNLLVGGNALPVQVTATQLPPVWISQGDRAPVIVDTANQVSQADLSRLGEVDVNKTKYVRFFRDADLLELCDILDMPGISDPNMDSEVWERVLPFVDMVIWCTHATQAWRQSEAAVWSNVRPELRSRSFLLLTRMDKIVSDRDRQRVVARVRKETDGLFSDIFAVSLTEAIAAGNDRHAWDGSGAGPFTQSLVDVLLKLQGEEGRARLTRAASRAPVREGAGLKVPKGHDPDRIIPRRLAASARVAEPEVPPEDATGKEPPLVLQKEEPLRLY